ncbi:MAG: beta-galactosidase [bacterium]|nr:beta-galactosidase [bacterium]
MNRRPFAAAFLAVLLVGVGSAQATPRGASPQPQPPQRFERILWTGALAEVAAPAAKLGFTAVQVGRGVDPAPAVAAGLGYYLDQPIGKGVLELRDAQFVPLRQAYEKDRDPRALIRPGCVATPGLIARLAEQAAAEAKRVAGPGLRFVALADEASATRHDAPLDTCWCEHCLADFRKFVQRRYRTVDRLNEAFGTTFGTFADAVPLSTDQVRRRELGDTSLPADLRPFAARLDFVDAQFAGAVHELQRAVQAAVPGVPVGLTGISAPAAFGASDPARMLPGLTLAEPYAIGGAVELAQSLLPAGAHRYTTLFAPKPETPAASVPLRRLVRAQLADMAAHGVAGMVVWNDRTVIKEPLAAAEPTAFGRAVRRGTGVLGPVLDACAGARIEHGPVWLVESQASVRAWWMLDSAKDGMTWPRRLGSYERTHSTSQAARTSWLALLRDLGFQPRFVAAQDLARRLPAERPRCVVLPATIALSDRSVQAIVSYARIGGTVLADHSPALYDERLLRRDRAALDELFGVTQRSVRWEDLRVREGRLLGAPARDGLPRAEHELRARLGERHRDGDAFAEHRPGRGHAVLLNAPVCEYSQTRLVPGRVGFARELRRRVRNVLQRARCRPICEVRGEGLPTLIERVPLRLRDGRQVIAIRLAALADPQLLQAMAKDGPRPVRVVFAKPRTVRELGGRDLGTGSEFELRLDPFSAIFLELVTR